MINILKNNVLYIFCTIFFFFFFSSRRRHTRYIGDWSSDVCSSDLLQGISAADWRKIRQLVIEVDLSQNLAPITALLEQQGFDVLVEQDPLLRSTDLDRKSTRLNSSHRCISYAVFCLKKKKNKK